MGQQKISRKISKTFFKYGLLFSFALGALCANAGLEDDEKKAAAATITSKRVLRVRTHVRGADPVPAPVVRALADRPIAQTVASSVDAEKSITLASSLSLQTLGDLSIVVSSCDKYAECWGPFFHSLFKYCSFAREGTVPVYLVSNGKIFEDPRVRPVVMRNERNWSSNMIEALKTVNTSYVLYMQEDLFLDSKVNEIKFLECLNTLRQKEEVGYIQLNFDRFFLGNEPYAPLKGALVKDRRNPYLNALQVALWRKSLFSELLSPEESPWEFEVVGVRRAQTAPLLFLSMLDENPLHVVNAIDKGKWTVDGRMWVAEEGLVLENPILGSWDSPESYWGGEDPKNRTKYIKLWEERKALVSKVAATPRVLVSYAGGENPVHQSNMEYLEQTAREVCTNFFLCNPSTVDADFREKYAFILNQPRGNGYWLWKPYIITKAIDSFPEGTTIFYFDAGIYIKYPDLLTRVVDYVAAHPDQIVATNTGHTHRPYCKKEVIHHFNLPDSFLDTRAVQANALVFQTNEKTRAFMKQWLAMCCTGDLITDAIYMPQDPVFRENRHDQLLLGVCGQFLNPNTFYIHPDLQQSVIMHRRRDISESFS